MCMPKVLFYGMIFAIVLAVGVNASPNQPNSNPVGYQTFNGTLHMWNQYDDYYFNISSGNQFTNHYQEYWAINYYCFGYKNPNWKYKCLKDLPTNNNILYTDNLTIASATIWNDVSFLGHDVRIAVQYNLSTMDDMLNITFYAKNIGSLNIPVDTGFAWILTNISILQNKTDNYLEFINGSIAGWSHNHLRLNDTPNHNWTNNIPEGRIWIYKNVTAEIHGINISTTEDIHMVYDHTLNHRLMVEKNPNWHNSMVGLLFNAGILSIGQEKSTVIRWHDRIVSCNRGTVPSLVKLNYRNFTDNQTLINETPTEYPFAMTGEFQFNLGCSLFIGCAKCNTFWDYSRTGGGYADIPMENYTHTSYVRSIAKIVDLNWTQGGQYQSNPFIQYNITVECGGRHTADANITGLAGQFWFGGKWDRLNTSCIDNRPPNVTLQEPANFSVFNVTNDGILFKCNASDNTKMNEIQLWENWTNGDGTFNENQTNVSGNKLAYTLNITANISGIPAGNHSWYCIATDTNSQTNEVQTPTWLVNIFEEIVNFIVTFIFPTPANDTTLSVNYTFINVTTSLAADVALLEWNGTNETMVKFNSTIFYVNKTNLTNGNYTYKAYANTTDGLLVNHTELRTLNIDVIISIIEDIDTWQFAISAGSIISILALISLTIALRSEHYVLLILFLIITLFVLVSHVQILSLIADGSGDADSAAIINSVGAGFVWIVIIALVYYILDVIFKISARIGDKFG